MKSVALLSVLISAGTALAAEPLANPPATLAQGERGAIGGGGRLFVSPMGEPFRGGDLPEQRWFAGADTNHDGRLSRAEFVADAMRFFALLDVDHDRRIGAAEIDRYERDILPEVNDGSYAGGGDWSPSASGAGGSRNRGGGRMGGGGHRRSGESGGSSREGAGRGSNGADGGYMFHASGAGRFGYLATPEPVTAADADLDHVVSAQEFMASAGRRFDILDSNGDGMIDPRELPKLRRAGAGRHRSLDGGSSSDH